VEFLADHGGSRLEQLAASALGLSLPSLRGAAAGLR
jgi:hypothetical protein